MTSLADLIQCLEHSHPDSLFIALGDFNHTSLTKELPRYKQQVKCPTRNNNILDHCYTTIPDAYHAIARAPLGFSDHKTILLFPKYRSKLKSSRPQFRSVRRWDTESVETLRGCLDCTDWQVFQDSSADLDEFTDVVTSYVNFCQQVCIPTRQIKVFPNSKPWFTSNVRDKIIAKYRAHKDGDPALYKKAKYELEKTIRAAKQDFRKKLEGRFLSGDSSAVWRGVQTVTDYKKKCTTASDNDPALVDKLNDFYARFDQQSGSPSHLSSSSPLSTPSPTPLPSASPCSATLPLPFRVEEHEVRKLFLLQNRRKAAGPDDISPASLKLCADQLAPVFTDIFNSSLQTSVIPRCFKTSVIIPVPKKPKIKTLNDYRPVALTSVVMKVFERLILGFLKSTVGDQLDPLQFAYRENRSAGDAVSLAGHHILQHLEYPGRYARILFLDFSSAFNTIKPHKLLQKLQLLSIPPSLCDWIFNYLSNRPQYVRFNNSQSSVLVLNTGAPQGCVLSPFLFSLFTNDCVSQSPSVHVIKFADDTTVEGLIQGADESTYRKEVDSLVDWCDANDLHLNISKTKEIVVDFRRKKTPVSPLCIKGSAVETVSCYKFLGTTISDTLCWGDNVNKIVSKAHQRMFFLRQLKKFGLRREILLSFYKSVVESVLTFSLCAWYGNTTSEQRKQLQRVVRQAERITSTALPSLQKIYDKRSVQRCRKILADPSHPAYSLYEWLPSGKRLRTAKTRTNRFKNSFYPFSVSLLNNVL